MSTMHILCVHYSPLYLQMLMSVRWRHTRATPMPTALTPSAASPAHAGMALKATDSTVQVCSIVLFGTKWIFLPVRALSCDWCDHCTALMQIFTSVTEGRMNVTQMQLASTHSGVMTACATLGSLEMDSHAQVGNQKSCDQVCSHATLHTLYPPRY